MIGIFKLIFLSVFNFGSFVFCSEISSSHILLLSISSQVKNTNSNISSDTQQLSCCSDQFRSHWHDCWAGRLQWLKKTYFLFHLKGVSLAASWYAWESADCGYHHRSGLPHRRTSSINWIQYSSIKKEEENWWLTVVETISPWKCSFCEPCS